MNPKALYLSGWLLSVAAGFGMRCVPALGLNGSGAGTTPLVTESGRVVRVVDGDTYDVLAGGITHRVRLLGVDAPERDQPFGKQATDSVARLLRPAQLVLLTRHGVDLYGAGAGGGAAAGGGKACARAGFAAGGAGVGVGLGPQAPSGKPSCAASGRSGRAARALEMWGSGRVHAAAMAAIQLQKQAALRGGLHLVAKSHKRKQPQAKRIFNF